MYPDFSYNMGAKLNQRVKELFTKLLIPEACVGAAHILRTGRRAIFNARV